MDLKELKNLDIKQLGEKLKQLEIFKDKKTLIKFGIGSFAVLLSLVIYYTFVSPVIDNQKAKLVTLEENIIKLDEYSVQIVDMQIQVEELEPEFKKNSAVFQKGNEVENLIQSVNNFAITHGLDVVSISRDEPAAVRGQLEDDVEEYDEQGNLIVKDEMMDGNDQEMDDTGMEGDDEGGPILYYKIPVKYELRGSFIGYLKFRREFSKSTKVVNFELEEIRALQQPQGQVLSAGTITIVGLPDESK